MKVNDAADANIVLNLSDGWQAQQQSISDSLAEKLDGHKLDAILCVAGGWAGGNAASKGMNTARYPNDAKVVL